MVYSIGFSVIFYRSNKPNTSLALQTIDSFNCTPRPPGLRVSDCTRDPQVYVHEELDCLCIIAPHDPPGVYDCDPQVYVHEEVDCQCIIAPHDPPGVYDCGPQD